MDRRGRDETRPDVFLHSEDIFFTDDNRSWASQSRCSPTCSILARKRWKTWR